MGSDGLLHQIRGVFQFGTDFWVRGGIGLESLLLTVLGHGISDFLLQSGETVRRKQQLKPVGYLGHALATWLVLLLLLHGYVFWLMFLFTLAVTGAHLAIDWGKSLYLRLTREKNNFLVFVTDQILHLAAIFGLWQVFDLRLNPVVHSFYHAFYFPKAAAVFGAIPRSNPGFSLNQLLLVLIVYCYICFGGSFLIRNLLQSLQQRPIPAGDHPARAGAYIGILERFLVLAFVQGGAIGSVAFILTAKSIARFSELNDRVFAEYYLTGTLTSTALAIGGGFLLNTLLPLLK